MAQRQKLTDSLLDFVAGGVDINNDFGDHMTYKIGQVDGVYTHTFKASDYNEIVRIAAEAMDPSKTGEENDALIMQALLNTTYLTPIA